MLPRYLFRYQSLATETQRQRFAKALSACELYFSSPLSFNDPFENRFHILPDGTEDSCLRLLSDPDNRRLAGLPPTGPVPPEAVKAFLAFMHGQGVVSDRYREQTFGDLPVCCLSASPIIPLMWSHYADGHRGICLCFDTTRDPELFSHAYEVQYSKTFPELGFFTMGPAEYAQAVVLTKAQWWGYEQEWRILLVDQPLGPHPYRPEALDSVILGCAAPQDQEAFVRASLAKSAPGIRVDRATIADGEYGLAVNRVS